MRFCHRILRGDSRRRRGFIATCAVVFYCCRLFPRPRGPCMRTVFAFFGFSSLRLPFFSLFFFLSFFFSSSSSSFFFLPGRLIVSAVLMPRLCFPSPRVVESRWSVPLDAVKKILFSSRLCGVRADCVLHGNVLIKIDFSRCVVRLVTLRLWFMRFKLRAGFLPLQRAQLSFAVSFF